MEVIDREVRAVQSSVKQVMYKHHDSARSGSSDLAASSFRYRTFLKQFLLPE